MIRRFVMLLLGLASPIVAQTAPPPPTAVQITPPLPSAVAPMPPPPPIPGPTPGFTPANDYITIGQDELGYRAWVAADPNRPVLVKSFNDYLVAAGVGGVAPISVTSSAPNC